MQVRASHVNMGEKRFQAEGRASEKCSVHSRNTNWSRGGQRRWGRKQITKGHLKTDVYSLTEGFRRT